MSLKIRKNGEGGFTIIEFMTAIALSACLLGALYSMLFASTKNWKNQRARSEQSQTARAALETVATDLENIVPFTSKAFRGNGGWAVFYTLLTLEDPLFKDSPVSAASPARQAVGRVEYSWERSDSGRYVLRRSWTAFIPESGNGLLRGTEIFPESITDFAFAYARRTSDGKDTSWRRVWSRPYLPEGVEIELTVGIPGLDAKTYRKIVALAGRV